MAGVDALLEDERDRLAGRAGYGGNPEHKRSPSDYGLAPPAGPRPGKTLCDGKRAILRGEAVDLLRAGLRRGMYSEQRGGLATERPGGLRVRRGV